MRGMGRRGGEICIAREQRRAREKAIFIVRLMLYGFIVRQIDAQLIYVVTLARARAHWMDYVWRRYASRASLLHTYNNAFILDFPLV